MLRKHVFAPFNASRVYFRNCTVEMVERPRRNRRTSKIRGLVRETHLTSEHLVLPLFVVEGNNVTQPINGYKKIIIFKKNKYPNI